MAAQKARQALSNDRQTKVKEDALLPGKDFRYDLQQEEFEATIAPEVQTFMMFLEEARAEF